MIEKRLVLILFLTFVFGVACLQQPTATPTLEPPPTVTVEQPTSAPEATATSAEAQATPEAATPTAVGEAPTAEGDAPTPTLSPTEAPTAEPTAAAATLDILEPAEDAVWNTGESVTLSGTAPAEAQAVAITLSAAGLTLASAEATPDASGAWQATLEVPATVSGAAIVRAAAGDGTAVERPVQLARAQATSGTAITLDYPQIDSTIVSGHVLFFTGTVQRPPEGTVSIAVLYEDCQTVASTTSFNVGEGGQWYGYLVIPQTVFGPGCAVAYTGGFDEPDWRAGHTPITILEEDDAQARGLFIGNFANSDLTPGEAITVYGSAYNVPNNEVQVALQIDGANVAQGTTTADRFGYWEINLVLPPDTASGVAGQFSATVNYDGESVNEVTPFEVVP